MAVKNLATVKTTADITSSATSIPVNRVNVFGDAPFYVTIMPASGDEPANSTNSEIVLVTGISGTNLTVTRGQRGTTAKDFNSGAIVTMGIYAEDAVLLGGDSSTTSTTAHEKKLLDKDGNTIIPITGYMGKVYTATLSSATAGETANYDFTPDTPVENNRVYAVKFPTPTVDNATIILGDGVVSGSIRVPSVAATDSPNYELLNTDMINNTEPLLLMYNGVQWVCLNQKNKVATADLKNNAVSSAKIDWTSLMQSGEWVLVDSASLSSNTTGKTFLEVSVPTALQGANVEYRVTIGAEFLSDTFNVYPYLNCRKSDGTWSGTDKDFSVIRTAGVGNTSPGIYTATKVSPFGFEWVVTSNNCSCEAEVIVGRAGTSNFWNAVGRAGGFSDGCASSVSLASRTRWSASISGFRIECSSNITLLAGSHMSLWARKTNAKH